MADTPRTFHVSVPFYEAGPILNLLRCGGGFNVVLDQRRKVTCPCCGQETAKWLLYYEKPLVLPPNHGHT